MKHAELIEEVKAEIAEDKKATARAKLKERLVEIEEAETVLAKLKAQLEDLLDADI